MLHDFELIGDSQLRRFGVYLRVDTPFCFSGFTISQLRKHFKSQCEIPPKVILLIGSNDLLENPSDEKKLVSDYRALAKYLLRKCDKVVLVAVPVIPRRVKVANHFKLVQSLNNLVYSFAANPKVRIVDLKTYKHPCFVRTDYFEKYFY